MLASDKPPGIFEGDDLGQHQREGDHQRHLQQADQPRPGQEDEREERHLDDGRMLTANRPVLVERGNHREVPVLAETLAEVGAREHQEDVAGTKPHIAELAAHPPARPMNRHHRGAVSAAEPGGLEARSHQRRIRADHRFNELALRVAGQVVKMTGFGRDQSRHPLQVQHSVEVAHENQPVPDSQ